MATPRPSQKVVPKPRPLPDRIDPAFKSVELIQRSRMVIDVAATDLEIAEVHLGPFHETTCYFRQALAEARRAWERLRATYGGAVLESALLEPPQTSLSIGDDGQGGPLMTLIPIAGRTYHVERIVGTPLAPVLWRLTRLPDPKDGPYYVCRLRDRTTRCDCAEWIYQVAEIADAPPCKHLSALAALGWI